MTGRHLARYLASVLTAGAIGAMAAGPAAAADSATCDGQTADITGTTGDDSGAGAIQGTSAGEVIVGLEGDDEIDGGGGDDLICGGSGDDLIVTGSGDDHLAGMDGEDELSGGAGVDYLDGGRDLDTCSGGGQPDDLLRGCTTPTMFLVGQKAPDFSARTAFANKFSLRDLRGQNVLLNFSTMWSALSPHMASQLAGVQSTLRGAGIEFTYVLVELEDNDHAISDRHDAEFFLERWSLQDSPVVHSSGSLASAPSMSLLNFSSENFAYANDKNVTFPTQVFIDPLQKVTEVHKGPLEGQEIVDRYGGGLPEPPATDPVTALLPGDNLEEMRSKVRGLSLKPKMKRPLLQPLMQAIQSIETRLEPEHTPCYWLGKFRKALKVTPGVSDGKEYELLNAAANVTAKLDC